MTAKTASERELKLFPDSIDQQLPLSVSLEDGSTFANFYVQPGSANELALNAVQGAGAGEHIYLWGERGSGCSHLLQAGVRSSRGQGIYLPLDVLSAESPSDVLASLDHCDLLALDSLDAVIGNPEWSEQLFYLYNRILEREAVLLVAAECAPAELTCALADLQSRLTSMQTHYLRSADDPGKIELMKLRARNRGFELPDTVGHYLLRHYSRDIRDQIGFLEKLDRRSLVAQRGLSIQLVKDALAEESTAGSRN